MTAFLARANASLFLNKTEFFEFTGNFSLSLKLSEIYDCSSTAHMFLGMQNIGVFRRLWLKFGVHCLVLLKSLPAKEPKGNKLNSEPPQSGQG